MSARSDPSSSCPGPTVVLTMASASADALIADVDAELRRHWPDAAAIEWVRWPLLDTRLIDPDPIAPVLARLDDYRWVVVPGPATIGALSQQMQRLGLGWPQATRVALVGPGSVATFQRAFGPAAITRPAGPPHDADHLLRVLQHDDPAIGTGRALVVNRLGAEPSWLPRLAAMFRSVDVLPVFEADEIDPPLQAAERLRQWHRQQRSLRWICGSVGQVERLGAWLVAGSESPWALQRPLQVPHPRIADRAQQAGFQRVTVFEDRSPSGPRATIDRRDIDAGIRSVGHRTFVRTARVTVGSSGRDRIFACIRRSFRERGRPGRGNPEARRARNRGSQRE